MKTALWLWLTVPHIAAIIPFTSRGQRRATFVINCSLYLRLFYCVGGFVTKEETASKNLQLYFRIIIDLIMIYRYLLSGVWLLGCPFFAWAFLCAKWRECKQSWKSTDTHSKESKQNHRQAAVWDQCERGSEHINKTNRLHALAVRAAAVAAAVPEQSPPASRLWGATPESPYWSLEWAETHFLWAQVTWRKEQKRVEARGHRVMRRRKTKKEVGCRWGHVLGRGEGRGGGGTEMRNRVKQKRKENKKL